MARLKCFAIRFFLTLVVIAWTARVEAAGHHYLILGTSSARGHQGHVAGHSRGQRARGQTVTATAYAWGWFGARPYSHGVRHRGYYNNAWAWSQ